MQLSSDLTLVGEDKFLNGEIPLPGPLKHSQVFDNDLLQNIFYKNTDNMIYFKFPRIKLHRDLSLVGFRVCTAICD